MSDQYAARNEGRFTEDEDEILRQAWPEGINAAHARLPGRSIVAVRRRARRLGLLSAASRKLSDDDVASLQRWIDAKGRGEDTTLPSLSDLAQGMGVTPSALAQRAKRMGYVPRAYTRDEENGPPRGGKPPRAIEKRERQGRHKGGE